MNQYHKIQTIFKRDMENGGKTLLEGDWTCPEFEYLANNTWTFTEKVDGTNIRIMWKYGKLQFGGKSDNAQIPTPLVNRLRDKFPDDSAFRQVFQDMNESGVCLYGEGYGPKIQKGGGNYSNAQNFTLFDVKIGHWWLKRDAVESIGENLGIGVVPIIGEGTLYECIEMVRGGFDSKWGPFQAEGIVARPVVDMFSRNGDRIITKIKCRDFPAK